MTHSEICAAMVAAEKKAGELVLSARNILAERKGSKRDVVTEYDRRVQEMLIAELGELLPDAHFFCEELGKRESLDAAHVFIIDPIDGTMNFVRGFHHSCTSIAYAEFGKVQAAAVYNPYVDEMFSAVRGEGCYLNGVRVHVAEGGLGENVSCFGSSPYNPELADETFSTARFLYDNSLDVRREGAAELDLCTVAGGRAGLFYEAIVSLWDYAAGALLVEEAGGVCLQSSGEPLTYGPEKSSILAGTPQAVADFLRLREKA